MDQEKIKQLPEGFDIIDHWKYAPDADFCQEYPDVRRFIDIDTMVSISKPQEQGCIECGSKIEPIIKQCIKCGGAIRACCPDHEDKC